MALGILIGLLVGFGIGYLLAYSQTKQAHNLAKDTLVYNNRLSESAFQYLKAQTLEQAVNAKDAEIRYKLQRDAALDELKKYASITHAAQTLDPTIPHPGEVVYDIEGNPHKMTDLEFSWR